MPCNEELYAYFRGSSVLRAVYDASVEVGYDPYLVGGSLRDFVAKGGTADFDFTLKDGAGDMAAEVAGRMGGSAFPLGREKGCFRVVSGEGEKRVEMDFTHFKGDGIEGDLQRRDFTINAMALSVKALFEGDGDIIDPLGGRDDLACGLLKLVSKSGIDEDPLRILRGFRIAASFSLDLDETFLAISSLKKEGLKKVSFERVRTELFKMLEADNSCPFFRTMIDSGVFYEVVPEILSWRDLDQGKKHKFRLLDHALKSLKYMESILSDGCPQMAEYEERLSTHLDEELEHAVTRRGMLKFAALLHDSGKPACFRREADKVTFHGHEEKGAEINKKIAKRLKMGRFACRALCNITRQHMRILHLSRLEKVTARAMDRFIRDCGGETPEILLLSLADAWATRDARDLEYTDVEKVVTLLMGRYFEEESGRERRLLKGRDVMEALGIEGGPDVGRYLALVSREEREGRINSKCEALMFLKRTHLKKEVEVG